MMERYSRGVLNDENFASYLHHMVLSKPHEVKDNELFLELKKTLSNRPKDYSRVRIRAAFTLEQPRPHEQWDYESSVKRLAKKVSNYMNMEFGNSGMGFEKLHDLVFEWVEETHHNGIGNSLDVINNLKEKIRNECCNRYVFKPIFGVKMKSNETIEIGIFAFHPNPVAAKDYANEKVGRTIELKLGDSVYVSVATQAHDNPGACLQAHRHFRMIENLLSLFLPKKYFIQIGTSKTDVEIIATAVASERRFDVNYVYPNEEECFIDAVLKNPIFKSILAIPNKSSQMEKKILTSAIWAGNAIREGCTHMGFLSGAISLETLLVMGRSVSSNSSITSQIREGAAFVLGHDYDSRDKISEAMAALYRKRSQIVHGGKCDVSEAHYDALIDTLIELIFRFMTDETLKKIKDEEEYRKFINQKKYS